MHVLAGVFTFLFGMNLMAKSLQALEHTKLKRWITRLSDRPWLSFLAAAFLSFFIQSSSTVSVLIVGLIAGRMIVLRQAFVLLLGANIGTAIRMPLLEGIVHSGFVVAGILAFFVWMIASRTDQRNIALSFIGTALVFIGLETLVEGLVGLSESLWFTETLRTMHRGSAALFHGVTLTTLLQSSGVSLHIVADLLRQGLVSLPAALYFMLGANIGTASTALLSTIGADIDAKRTAILHLLINAIGAILFWPVLWLSMLLMQEEMLRLPSDELLWGAHLLFNLFCALLFLPLTRWFLRLVRFLVPAPLKRRSSVPAADTEETSLLVLKTHYQALFRSIWAYTKQVFHLFQTMEISQIERCVQLRENIQQTKVRLRGEFFQETKKADADTHDPELLRVIGMMEDMEILYELAHDVFLLASDRILHQRSIDPVSAVALRVRFKNTLDLVYLCAQLGTKDPEELARAHRNQAEMENSRAVYLRNVLVAVQEGVLDEHSADDLLAVHRLLERMNLAGGILLAREDTHRL